MWAQNRQPFATDWSFNDWKFVTQVKTNGKVLTVDNVQEYDDGAVGQRSRMNDGSGSAEWVYTSRGQLQSEKKTIGSDVFLTQYGYHPDGSVRWMQYPGGIYGPFTYAFSASTGNLITKEGTTLGYDADVSYPAGERSIPHAASSFSSTTYSYDCNGNQRTRTELINGIPNTQTRSFDTENRLVGVGGRVLPSGVATASFVYDGDGNRVKGTVGSTTTVYLGGYFEWTGSTSSMKRYYYADSIRIAIRIGNGTGVTGLSWLFGDHLGSTSLAVDMNATRTGEHRYRPYGENRFTYQSLPTTFDFTGQRLETSLGLHFYQARWYDSQLGRFLSADTIIPKTGGVLAWDRYLFVLGNPLKYTDPSGHEICMDDGDCSNGQNINPVARLKGLIYTRFGISISDDGSKKWGVKNLNLMYRSLDNINRALVGELKSLVGSGKWTFKLGEYVAPPGELTQYSGRTNAYSRTVTFYTIGEAFIRQMNIYHEFGHVLNSLPGKDNTFSNALGNLDQPSFINKNGFLNEDAFLNPQKVSDPNYGPLSVKAIQHGSTDPKEQWADIFANAMAGNINVKTEQGADMYMFIIGELTRVISP